MENKDNTIENPELEAVATEDVYVPSEEASKSESTRIVLAVGDLHGDYYRLIRYLRELELLLPGTMAWNPERNNVDLIFIGDYTDWRGEPIETPDDETPEDGALGGYKIINFILHLDRELELLRRQDRKFDSHFYPLLGNHDEMMLSSAGVFSFVSVELLQELLAKAHNFVTWKRHLSEAGLNNEQIEQMLGFLNWYVQGGEVTIQGFGGMQSWKEAMEGEIGHYLRENLYLAVVVNHRVYAHSLPDKPMFWRPLKEIAGLPKADYEIAKEAFTWGRKVWGYDFSSGMRCNRFTDNELTEMLEKMGGNSAVIGHTPLSHSVDHVVAYDGRVVNIDVHGCPGGKAFLEEYEGRSEDNKAPLRSAILAERGVECLA